MLQLSMTGPLTELVSQIEDLRSEGVTQLNAGGPLGADPEQTIRLIGRPPTGGRMGAFVLVATANAKAPLLYSNCTHLNARYPHGVGRLGAHDHASETPLTTFKCSTRIYNIAMKYNRGLDRDHDGVACEQR